jgi:hypothetical protein
MAMKLTMVSVFISGETHTRFVMLPVCPDTGKVRADYSKMFKVPHNGCTIALGR